MAEVHTAMREQELRIRKLVALVTELHEGMAGKQWEAGPARSVNGDALETLIEAPRVAPQESGADGTTEVVVLQPT
jgi:hypothetical protein